MKKLLRRKPPGRRGVDSGTGPPPSPTLSFIADMNKPLTEDDYNIILKRGDYETILEAN